MRESINNSFKFANDSVVWFITNQPFIFIIILIILFWTFISNKAKDFLKEKYITPYERGWNTENREFYIRYYKKVQYLDIIGAVLIIILLFVYLLTKDKIIGTVLAVWIWSILITFQTFTVSFITYFMLINNFKIWDTITIKINWEKLQWEILYIKLLYIWISWKNDFWENTWQFFRVPNYQTWNNPIGKIDLSLDWYAKESLTIVYNSNKYKSSFSEFNSNLRELLDWIFSVRWASKVSYFKSYIWVKYKIDYTYDKDWNVNIRLWFISKRFKAQNVKSKIISFVEDQKIKE